MDELNRPDIPQELLKVLWDAFVNLEDYDDTEPDPPMVLADQPEFQQWISDNRHVINSFLRSDVGRLDAVLLMSELRKTNTRQ